jgi:NAD(P)H dehydrogenase (quinone)
VTLFDTAEAYEPTVAGGDGSRQPTEIDLAGTRHHGMLVAKTAAKIFG